MTPPQPLFLPPVPLRHTPCNSVHLSRHHPPRCCKTPLDTPNERLVRYAMLNDHPAVENLLSQGASPLYASPQGDSSMTALMWAASEGNVAITRTLLSVGADPNMRTKQGLTALVYAFENLPSANPRPAPPPGFPGRGDSGPVGVDRRKGAMRRSSGHGEVIKLLLGAGADIKARNAFGESVVHMAARKGQTGWVEVGLAGGVDKELRSVAYEESALHVACKEGHADVVRALVEAGADMETRSRYGWTPLVWAAACASVECVRVLLEYGADATVRTFRGRGVEETTALKEARKSGKPRTVERMLREAGARE